MNFRSLATAVCSLLVPALSLAKTPDLREGDIVFSSSSRGQGEMIVAATGSPITHCGIVFQSDGKLMVLEAVQPVRAIPLETFVARCGPGKFSARRLKSGLTPANLKSGRDWALQQVGKDYDHRFLWSDDAIYCSELVWKTYKYAGIELCKPRQFKDYHLDDPKVRKAAEERFGKLANLPREEKVVAPSDLAASTLLEEIGE